MLFWERRVLYADQLRNCCIQNDYYINGTNEEYENLFALLRTKTGTYKHFATADLAELAADIKAHSDTDHDITDIMFELAKVCTVYFYEEE